MDNINLVCNICGNKIFKKGPLGRVATNGTLPQCEKCGSLERHRILKKVWNLLPNDFTIDKNALQFSMDPSVDSSKFKTFEISVYEHKNSLDLQQISRDDDSYDIIICNQILEHVENDIQAFLELLRITNDDGFIQFTVPNPILRKITEDWGYAKTEFHGHYRHYGIDLIDKFLSISPMYKMINICAKDDVTGLKDYVFFWMKNKATQNYLLNIFENSNEVEIERYI